MAKKIKALAVDDNAIYRKIMTVVLNKIPEIGEIDTAPNGAIALNMIEKNKPDLVVLDIEMPELDGVSTLKVIKEKYPEIGVIMASSVTSIDDTDATIRALELGALDFIPKPQKNTSIDESFEYFQKKLMPVISSFFVDKVSEIVESNFEATISHNKKTHPAVDKGEISPKDFPKEIKMIVIGVSTGGPNILSKIIPSLDKEFPIPIIIVQHMPPLFTKSLSNSLNMSSKIRVFEAEEGMEVKAGTVYIAHGGSHLVLNKSFSKFTLGLTDEDPINNMKPSINKLLDSTMLHFNNQIACAILTGMGTDGTDAITKASDKLGWVIAQDKTSCTVYGMSRSVIENGLANEIISGDQIAQRLTEIANKHGVWNY